MIDLSEMIRTIEREKREGLVMAKAKKKPVAKKKTAAKRVATKRPAKRAVKRAAKRRR
jgi:hypothetical protein